MQSRGDGARALDCTGGAHVLMVCGMRAEAQANLDGAVKLYLQSKGKLSAGDLTANQVTHSRCCLHACIPTRWVTAAGCPGHSPACTRENAQPAGRRGLDCLHGPSRRFSCLLAHTPMAPTATGSAGENWAESKRKERRTQRRMNSR